MRGLFAFDQFIIASGEIMERAMGFEPTTTCLGSKYATAASRPPTEISLPYELARESNLQVSLLRGYKPSVISIISCMLG